jgi:phosphate butyryltransferase
MRINLENFKLPNTEPTIVVAGADDHVVLEALNDANQKITIKVILIGDENKINDLLRKYSLNVKQIINETDPSKIGELAVQCIKNNQANIIMKGLIDTKHVLKAVVNSTTGIRRQKVLSHVALMDYPEINNSLIISDCAMNITPNADDK